MTNYRQDVKGEGYRAVIVWRIPPIDDRPEHVWEEKYGPYNTLPPAKAMITRCLRYWRDTHRRECVESYVEVTTGWERLNE